MLSRVALLLVSTGGGISPSAGIWNGSASHYNSECWSTTDGIFLKSSEIAKDGCMHLCRMQDDIRREKYCLYWIQSASPEPLRAVDDTRRKKLFPIGYSCEEGFLQGSCKAPEIDFL